MSTVYVQFADSTKSVVVSYFQSEQPVIEGDTRVLGTVETSDPIWKAYFDLQSPEIQSFLPAPD